MKRSKFLSRFLLTLLLLMSVSFISHVKAQDDHEGFTTVWDTRNPSVSITGGNQSNNRQVWVPYYFRNPETMTPQNGGQWWIEYRRIDVNNPAHNGSIILFGLGGWAVPHSSGYRAFLLTLPASGVYELTLNVNVVSSNHAVLRRFRGMLFSAPMAGQTYGDINKIIGVKRWGRFDWSNLVYAFANCTLLDIAPDAGKLKISGQTDNMFGMFYRCKKLNSSNLNTWDVSNIKNMGSLFYGATKFNKPLDNWDVSKVENMYSMFRDAKAFNQPLRKWNIDNCLDFRYMFSGATNFNQNLGSWAMITRGAPLLPQDDSNLKLDHMFDNCGMDCANYSKTQTGWFNTGHTAVNNVNLGAQGLTYNSMVLALGFGRKHQIDDHDWTFVGDNEDPWCGVFTIVVRSNNTAVPVDTSPESSSSCAAQGTGGGGGGVSKAASRGTTTSNTKSVYLYVPSGAKGRWQKADGSGAAVEFTIPESPYPYKITFPSAGDYRIWLKKDNPQQMLRFITAARKGCYFADVRKIIKVEQWGINPFSSMAHMFDQCNYLTISAHDTPNMIRQQAVPEQNAPAQPASRSMAYMFRGCSNLADYGNAIKNWNTKYVLDFSHMFEGCGVFAQDFSQWDFYSAKDISAMFRGCRQMTHAYLYSTNPYVGAIAPNVEYQILLDRSVDVFRGCRNLRSFKTNAYIDGGNTSGMFDGCVKLKADTIFPYGLTSKRTARMFKNCYLLNSVFDGVGQVTGISQPGYVDFRHVAVADSMFYNCREFNQPLYTTQIGCSPPTGISGMSAAYMFYGARKYNSMIFDVRSGGLPTRLINTKHMLYYATAYNHLSTRNWDVSRVTDMSYMFAYASNFNQPLDIWDVRKAHAKTNMFQAASKFDQNLGNWKFEGGQYFMTNMFDNSGMSCHNYAQTLKKWASYIPNTTATPVPGAVTLGVKNLKANFEAVQAKHTLTTSRGWSFVGDTEDLGCDGFTTIWNTQNPPVALDGIVGYLTSDQTSIYFPGIGDNYTITYQKVNIDGTPDGPTSIKNNVYSSESSPVKISFGAIPGYYKITVFNGDGHFDRMMFTDEQGKKHGDIHKILGVISWGKIKWKGMQNAFRGCNNLIIDNDAGSPDLSMVTSTHNMFRFCPNLRGQMNHWDVSHVKDMSQMFRDCIKFNEVIKDWNVSGVTNMNGMFHGATAFNQQLNRWNTQNVTDMGFMFYKTGYFNQPLNNWNVSKVVNMNSMFREATAFNQPLNNWVPSKVRDMGHMFRKTGFNQPIGGWNLAIAHNMSFMFAQNTAFNQPLNNWNVSTVTTMNSMFSGATAFNQALNSWDVRQVGDMQSMFLGAKAFDNSTIGDWGRLNSDVKMGHMLDNSGLSCENYTATLKKWASKPVGTLPINRTLGALNLHYEHLPEALAARNNLTTDRGWTITGDIKTCRDVFITIWDTTRDAVPMPGHNLRNNEIKFPGIGTGYTIYWENVEDPSINGTLEDVNSPNFGDGPIVDFGENNPQGEYRVYVSGGTFNRIQFGNISSSGDPEYNGSIQLFKAVEKWGSVEWSSMKLAFAFCRDFFFAEGAGVPDLSNVTDMTYMFYQVQKFNTNINNWNVSNVTNMTGVFHSAGEFNQPLNQWNVSNVTTMRAMFANSPFNQDISSWNVSNVTEMGYMFYQTRFNQPIGNWQAKTYKVKNMEHMFHGNNAFNQRIDMWEVRLVTNMKSMFEGATAFNQPISAWEVSRVTDMNSMFKNASSFDQSLFGWDVSKVVDMREMFADATAFDDASLMAWDLNANVQLDNMLDRCGLSCKNYGTIIQGWAQKSTTPTNRTLGAEGLRYGWVDARGAHNQLVHGKGWTITGDNVGCGEEFITLWETRAAPSEIYNHTVPSSDQSSINFPIVTKGCEIYWEKIDDPAVSGQSMLGHIEAGTPYTLHFPRGGQYYVVVSGRFLKMQFTGQVHKQFYGDAGKLLAVMFWGDNRWGDMRNAFRLCQRMNIDEHAGIPNIRNVYDMSFAFSDCEALNADLSGWDVTNVRDMVCLFQNTPKFNQSLASWNPRNLRDATDMFSSTGIDCGNLTATFHGWANHVIGGETYQTQVEFRRIAPSEWGSKLAYQTFFHRDGLRWRASPLSYRKNCSRYWQGAVDGDWLNPQNWYPHEPANMLNDSIIFANADRDDLEHFNLSERPARRDLLIETAGGHIISKYLENYTNRRVIIPARAEISYTITDDVKGSETLDMADRIYVEAENTGSQRANGTLKLPKDSKVFATVVFDSKARRYDDPQTWTDDIVNSPTYGEDFSAQYLWQFFGSPVKSVTAYPTFAESFMRRYEEAKNGQNYYEKWQTITDENEIEPFHGYEITYEKPTKYQVKGELNTSDVTLTLTRQAIPASNGVRYGLGQNLFANSYTQSIPIQNLTFPEELEKTVYLYNTGSFVDWADKVNPSHQTGTLAGQYTAIPQNVASTIMHGRIPSMQGFLLKYTEASTVYSPHNVDVTVQYDNLVPNLDVQRASSKELSYLRVGLDSKSTHDDVFLYSQEGTSEEFDNGWDGRKYFGTPTAFIFSETESGPMQVNTSETLADKVLTFYANKDTEYKLTIIKNNLAQYKDLTLVDLKYNRPIRLEHDTTIYEFQGLKSDILKRRFKIFASEDGTLPVVDAKLFGYYYKRTLNVQNNTKFDNGRVEILDVSGRLMFEGRMHKGINSYGVTLKEGAYVVHLVAGYNEHNFKIFVK